MAEDSDNASQLVAQLLEKLASLDTKVKMYRQDMAQDFQRHSRELLEDVPRDVASKVEQTVADSLLNYPALNPGFSDLASSLQADQIVDPLERIDLDRRARAGSRSPPPKLPHTSGVPREQGAQRSPHEREREFHDSSAPSSSSLNTVATLRPDPTRRHTEETLSSVTSDDSGSRSRPRSALRRSSSSSTKTQSPRRVRFEVEGTEVLPTMSPMLSPRISDLPPSPLNSKDNVLGEFEDDTSLLANLGDDYNDDAPETELLGSSPPRPKKVSSTDKLKALARSSTEDTSKWTVVGDLQGSDDEEDELVMGGRSGSLRGAMAQAASRAQPGLPSVTQDHVGHHINDPRLPTQLGAGLPVVKERDEDIDAEEDEDYDSSDSDELTMPARGSKKVQQSPAASRAPATPVKVAPPAPSTGTAGTSRSSVAASTSTAGTSSSEDTSQANSQADEEDMFDFDDENHGSSKSADSARAASSKYIEEEEDEADVDSPVTTPLRRAPPPNLPSATRNVSITKSPQPPKSPTSAIANGLMGTSMGSYKGRSIMLGSVKNEQLHEQVSRMGNFTSFVGSVDGRTGVDEKGSYRPEGLSFTGTPKSLSERMLREELEEEEAARKGASATS